MVWPDEESTGGTEALALTIHNGFFPDEQLACARSLSSLVSSVMDRLSTARAIYSNPFLAPFHFSQQPVLPLLGFLFPYLLYYFASLRPYFLLP